MEVKDFTLPEGVITTARAKKLKESFKNLATLIHEEMYQLLAKEEKIKPIGLNVEKSKSCLEIHWARVVEPNYLKIVYI
ncbi:hypothetical protein PIB30_033484 [Stylosanthes scabra]|uniref:Uncharacterized protein n=1 Tax=Stylosanthes scabra TaxID=79078 RepID=A0ABU6XA55_9FABA|nr:hypothetical protein [Stylosanthes scabra]